MRSLHRLIDSSEDSGVWLYALPAIAALLVWWPSLTASFQFDDWNVIVDEPRVHSLAAWWHSMPGIRPLLKLSYALNFAASEEAAGFRIVNMLIHALNATLVYWLLDTLRRWLVALAVPRSQLDTLRLRLLKIGGRVWQLGDRVRLRLASSHPGQLLWARLALARGLRE